MATEADFVDYILDQAGLGERLVGRKMFGEYGFHLDGKFVGMACENSFFIKHTRAIDELGQSLPARPPYQGAKPYPVADKLLDEPLRLRQLLLDTAELLPEPKAKAKRKRKPKAR